MKKLFFILSLVFGLQGISFGQFTLTCGDMFYDSGGANGNYSNNADDTTVICPNASTYSVQVSFSSFSVDVGDYLHIFEGDEAIGEPIITYSGILTGNNLPVLTSSSTNGCFVFVFHSDFTDNFSGWEASIDCLPKMNSLICGSLFTDFGELNGNYPNNADDTTIICPTLSSERVELSFSSFELEDSNILGNVYDSLTIYNGNSTTDPIIGSYYGTNSPGTVTSTHTSGCLTVVFHSDSGTNKSGWEALIDCVPKPFVCGNLFTDAGGVNGNYSNNTNNTIFICPTNQSLEVIVLTFTSFELEPPSFGFAYDYLTIYNGNSISDPEIGTFTGDENPGTVYSTNQNGCLTAVFYSDNNANFSGWEATIECVPPPINCVEPNTLTLDLATENSATISWTNAVAQNFIVEYGPKGFTPGTGTKVSTNQNPYTINGLTGTTAYDFYVRSYCGVGDTSFREGPLSFQTTTLPFVCGNLFTDDEGLVGTYANNTQDTTVICPTSVGPVVSLYFTSFNTQEGQDSLTIYNGNSTSDNIIGSFSGNVNPGTIYSTNSNGCLTTVFHSNGGVEYWGWSAQINCFYASVSELEMNKVNIYPNPSHGNFTIKNESDFDLEAELLDAQGRKLSGIISIERNTEIVLDLNNFDNGIYFLKTEGVSGVKTYHLIKN